MRRIAELLSEHPVVRQAAVVPQATSTGPVELLAYVESAAEGPPAGVIEGHLAHWQALWGGIYSEGLASCADPELNLAGWCSSYTGSPIREAEMRDWVEHTVGRILALQPRRVLEVGCGTGLLLLRVAPRCLEYRGLDFSAEALAAVRRRIAIAGLEQVALEQRAADDLGGIERGRYDVVVINSVAQYFPSADYFLQVLEGALAAAAPGARLFLGDIRSLPLLKAFRTAVCLQQHDSAMPRAELARLVAERVRDERELTFDPRFFHALRRRFPQIAGVEVQLKRGRPRNEMTRFRYDVVLTLEGGEAGRVPRGEPRRWLDWSAEVGSLVQLRKLLTEERPPSLGLRRVPNARLASEVAAVDLLDSHDPQLATLADLQAALARVRLPGIDPEELWALERSYPYTIEVTWSAGAQGADGTFDVILRHRERADADAEARAEASVDRAAEPELPLAGLTNCPLRLTVERRLETELRRHLESRGPVAHPLRFEFVPRLPESLAEAES